MILCSILAFFISLSVTGIGCYLIAKTVLAPAITAFTATQIVIGSLLILLGLALSIALAITIASSRSQHRTPRKGGSL